jgi:SAM-dependent methyltransferase
MAPELAIARLRTLTKKSVVLDPMAGSGTVLRQASELGHRAIGFDTDPLAVLMSRVWTRPVADVTVDRLAEEVVMASNAMSAPDLPWIDQDDETKQFIDYWFANRQQADLRRLAYAIAQLGAAPLRSPKKAALDVLRLALSRIIITKEHGASLARDVSHSRPHKIAESSTFNVIPAFEKAVKQIRKLLMAFPPVGEANVSLGDARFLRSVGNGDVDAVLTSPPYLNAIDYMRGHRLSLVWLGYRLSDLRSIRSSAIGAERGPDHYRSGDLFHEIQEAMGPIEKLSSRDASMVARYAEDIYRLISEVARVLKPSGKAILVVGNSCLKGTFIRNSDGVIKAARMVGLKLRRQVERDLPTSSRYLPIPNGRDQPLGKRMRTESIMSFAPG